jgi:ATP-dependent DNA helicase DinG
MEKDWLAGEAAQDMRHEIAVCSGNEVFFAGWLDNGYLSRVKVLARGNKFSVPVVRQQLKPGMMVLHNHPGGDLTPSGADISVASRLGQDGIGFAIVNNSVDRSYIVVEPHQAQEDKPVVREEVHQILGPGGRVSLAMMSYESRPQQLEMALAIAGALSQGTHALIEAGTGTGKSLAYLVPSLLWAIKNERRIVISTNTINLQEQLLHKDIPLLQQLMPSPFKAVLIKGRGNYLCNRKFSELLREGSGQVEEDDIPELQALATWSQGTREGSKSDLSFSPRPSLWELVSSDGDTCLRLNCPQFRDCWFHKARREAVDAQVLIVNHSLLFADLVIRAQGGEGGLMPSYHSIILDEAHNVEDAATEWFGLRLTRRGLTRSLSRLYSARTGGAKGLLPLMQRKLQGTPGAKSLQDFLHQEVIPELNLAGEEVQVLFRGLEQMLTVSGQREAKQRLTQDYCRSQEWHQRREECAQLQNRLARLANLLSLTASRLEEIQGVVEACLGQLVELEALARRLAATERALGEIFSEPNPERVRWLSLEQGRFGSRVSLHDAPLSVQEPLQEHLWQKFATVVLTSATMAVDNSFGYLKERLGLSKGVKELILSSPFDYHQQVLLGVATALPEPEQADFLRRGAEAVAKSLVGSRGRALVLFTSFSMLKAFARHLAGPLKEQGIPLLCQGEMPRNRLLEMFRRDTSSVLLATASFWEGVDVAGESLSSLIITRLPFTVPDEPILEARVEQLRLEGKNPFLTYQVPQAVLKLRQGFGRLIRTKRDRGIILILDRRVKTKFYGALFLRSLPPCPLITGSVEDILAKQRQFLEQ